jgi:hypothetical protein
VLRYTRRQYLNVGLFAIIAQHYLLPLLRLIRPAKTLWGSSQLSKYTSLGCEPAST